MHGKIGSRIAVPALVSILALVTASFAQDDSTRTTHLREMKVSGPRVGLTVVAGDKIVENLEEYDTGTSFSQFGWQWEWRVTPESGKVAFLVEFIPLIGGVEQGVFIPSATALMGVRMFSGWELGIGPNVSPIGSAVVVAAGYAIDAGGVTVPLNLAYASSPEGGRITFTLGFGIFQSVGGGDI